MELKDIAWGQNSSVVSRGMRRHGGRAGFRAAAADEAARRAVPGHWEGEPIIGKGGETALASWSSRP
jgi:IS30 family transposase